MKSIFLRNVLTLVSGNAVAFIAPVLLYPLLSRIFSKDDYALFGLYISVFSFFEVASVLRYDHAIVIPENEKDSTAVMAGGLMLSSFYAAFVLLLVICFKEVLSDGLNNPDLSNWLFLLPPSLLLVSFSKVLNAWLVRQRKFRAASINKASQKIAELIAQMVGGLLLTGGLLWGDLMGRVFNAAVSAYQSFLHGLSWKNVDFQVIKSNLRRYADLPKYNLIPSMLNAMAGMTPVFVVSYYFATDESGSFNFSRLLLSVPFALISNAVSQVVMQQVSELRHRQKKCSPDISDLAGKLSLISLAGMVPIVFYGPELFSFVFGDKWSQAGDMSSVLIFSYAFSFVVSPFSVVLVVLEKIKWISAWQLIYFVSISALWFMADMQIDQFLIILVAIDLVSYGFYGFLIIRAIKVYERNLV